MDKIAIALTDDGALRVYAAVTTELVKEACKLHNTSPVASAALQAYAQFGHIYRLTL